MFKKIQHKVKDKIKQWNQDDRGSAFVFVIIGVMFVSILGATVLSMTTNYLVTVVVDNFFTDNFYQTDALIAEVRSGIEEVAGRSNEKAYMEVVENYNSTSTSMQEEYGKKFLSGIMEELTGSPVNWDGTNQPDFGAFDITPIRKMTRRPDEVDSTYGGGVLHYGFYVDSTTQDMFLRISGLKVDYTDESGYRTKISTDIDIAVPDYGFEGDSTLEELKNYIVISDGQLTVNNTVGDQVASVKGVDFVGNVYAGGSKDASNNYDAGIVIDAQSKADFKSKMIISRGSLQMSTGSNVQVNGKNGYGDLWVKNILLKSAGDPNSLLQSQLSINTNAYVLDDLTIDDNNSIVNLAGKYYGYSYNETNSSSAGAQTSLYSSAILVNGKNTMLSANGLNKLILAGRTFVSRNDQAGTPVVSDIMMGESLAVKSNQIAYMLADEYIKKGHNPLVRSEIVDVDNILNECVNLQALKLSDIWQYLDSNNPIATNFNNEGGYVFLYLNFKDQVSANNYFSQYYSNEDNKSNLDERAETYISTSDPSGMKLSASLYLLAGNIVHNYYETAAGSSVIGADYFDGSGNPNTELLADGAKKMQNYLGKQLTLLNSGYKSSYGTYRYELMNSTDQTELVEDVIIDFSELTSMVSHYDSETGATILFTPGDYVVDGSIDKGLIVSGGDVSVQNDFEGLIIAKGKVMTYGQDLDEIANISLIAELLDKIEHDDSLDMKKYFRAMQDDKETTQNVAECISYINWTRNE